VTAKQRPSIKQTNNDNNDNNNKNTNNSNNNINKRQQTTTIKQIRKQPSNFLVIWLLS